ncbi:PREDICTED: protein SENESCENCE-ASSOCIATED GENE 21, mitochondrial-like [Ipomoea nil]|uniref:protein SENESCENCE-ASSOCIATED GENE 21, mitochondrial-like n=1 Tax=Ipomoea nil TaxID=35883 RepID=UPI000901756C|nr:PREDICTED: protein SENESCENCE-ASSOCIATED GENE 21, mitochondrial-like [Ipomoea nil]
MARSFSNAKLVSAYVADRVSVAVRRGYAAAAASQGKVSGGGVMKKAGEASRKETSWVPDPVTGYYRPENIAKEMDAAEMRAALLNNQIRRN